MTLLSRLQGALSYTLARAIVEVQSQSTRLKTLGKREVIHQENRYDGQPILLLALFQKGVLRPDLVRLLRAAKSHGMYVLAVNTLKLHHPSEIKDLVDCYIEKPNFGRDFGSYKTAFAHVYKRDWSQTCPRLLMVNDSVYYSTRGLDKFLDDMVNSSAEVLGATENYEIEYHLGSFCISMSPNVLRSKNLRDYWKNYRLTDVRPIVIKRGEMDLSKVLKRSVSRPSAFAALYSSNRFLNEVKSSAELQDLVIKDSRTSSLTVCPRFSVEMVTKQLAGRVVARRYPISEQLMVNIDTPLKDLSQEVLILNRDDLSRYLLRHVDEISNDFEQILGDTVSASASEVFMLGSQIHQNAAILLHIGLPIIKLDGLYRGMLNNYDLLKLKRKLDPVQAAEVGRLLMERPFGGQMLVGWKRAAFMRGLI